MTDTIIKGQMETHQAFWPKGFPGSLDETPFTYDPEKAKQILADAGVATPITVTLDVINSAPFTDMAQSLQASFAEAGINFEILPGTGSQVITKYRDRSHQAMLLYWGPDFMDPHSNAKAFAYNADNSDGAYAATTTWRNAWAVPEEMNALTLPPSPSPTPTSGWRCMSTCRSRCRRNRLSSSCSRPPTRLRWTRTSPATSMARPRTSSTIAWSRRTRVKTQSSD